MGRIKTFGDRIPPGSLGSKLVGQVPAAKTSTPPIRGARYARNGLTPDIALINSLNEQTNHGVLYRTKEVFRACPPQYMLAPLPSSASSSRARWRWAFHTGPYTHALKAIACLVPQSTNPEHNSYARLDISTSSTYATTAATANFYYGAAPGGTVTYEGGWEGLKVVEQYLEVDPDTTYYGRWLDMDQGILMSACVHELASMTQHNSGYLSQTISAGSDILDVYRQNLATIQYNLWRRGGAHVLNWSSEGDDAAAPYGTAPPSIATATETNIIDFSSTSVSASTPGFTLDMRYKNRVSQTSGVPCIMRAYGKNSDPASDASVILKDSSGATVAQIVTQWPTTGQWKGTSFTLPATAAKYDLHFASDITLETFTLYAVSIYEYES